MQYIASPAPHGTAAAVDREAAPRQGQGIRAAHAWMRRMTVEEGQRFSWQRTFTAEDVEAFTRLSGDRGIHHLMENAAGRIMVQGLLTATLPTKIGGDLDYIAREMSFEFLRPVFVGDTVRVEAVVTHMSEGERQQNVVVRFECHNQDGTKVMTGSTRGIIWAQRR